MPKKRRKPVELIRKYPSKDRVTGKEIFKEILNVSRHALRTKGFKGLYSGLSEGRILTPGRRKYDAEGKPLDRRKRNYGRRKGERRNDRRKRRKKQELEPKK